MADHSNAFRAHIQGMDHQAWGKLRQELVASLVEIMRDCDEQEVRATAYEALVMLKVIH